jgi:hypothetical protein
MFAPPIRRRRWRNNAFRSARSDEVGGLHRAIRSERSRQSSTERATEYSPLVKRESIHPWSGSSPSSPSRH